MSKTKRAARMLLHPNGDGDQIALDGFQISDKYLTTEKTETQGIADLLLEGSENSISTKTLVRLTGCGSARQLQKRIERERAQGRLILSNVQGGYYLPSSGRQGRLELEAFVRTLNARAFNTLRAAAAARRALRRWDERS